MSQSAPLPPAELMGLAAAPAEPTPARPVADIAGDAASSDALARLNSAMTELKRSAALPWLQAAVTAMGDFDWKAGAQAVLKALALDEKNGLAWHLLAICREKSGDFTSAFDAYEAALSLLADPTDVANDLGRLAQRLGQVEIAEKLYWHFLARRPGHVEASNNLACVLRDAGRYDEAIELLKPLLLADPSLVVLWNTLGTVLSEQADVEQSFVFFEEALRLDPRFAKARYNRGNAKLALGDAEGALDDVEDALPGAQSEQERAMMTLARATALMSLGHLTEGFEDYEARFSPASPDAVHFALNTPRWTPDSQVAGKSVLVVAEQGLGDEVLFANVLPDLAEEIGPDGKLHIAVERRLVPLFQRSFPQAVVGAHRTYRVTGRHVRFVPFAEELDLDLLAPVASLFRRYRPHVEAFPARERFLQPDPIRVEHWRARLAEAGPGPKVGLLWKSLKVDGTRGRYFAPFDMWLKLLDTPGLTFVNLQYGDCSRELAQAAAAGHSVFTPPDIDLKDDLDDLAALCSAMDLVIGPANATSNIAAAVGAPLWLITTPDAWPRFGTDRYPCYPQARVFHTPAFNRWDLSMQPLAEALASFARTG